MDIILKHISKSYGDKQVLSDFSATFPHGSITALMAPSGAGKTTLLRLILGLESPDSGSISDVPGRCSALFQEDRLCAGMTLLGNLRLALGRKADSPEARTLLQTLGLSDSCNLPVGQLSGGMARRAALARALLYDSGLLVLDEPFNGLDEENRRLAAGAIRQYAEGRTVILVTHRQEDAALVGAGRILRFAAE